jgi:ribosomal protein S18 acetylase RimI-like enzyme
VRLRRFDRADPSKTQRKNFVCGEATLDRWLASQARQSMESRDAVSYLLLDEDALLEDGRPRIAGYFCLSSGEVKIEETPEAMAKRPPPEAIPAVRMGRFAIDERYQGAGWGPELLSEALRSAVAAGDLIGARVMLVDAISEKAFAFYERFGFTPSPIHPMQLLYDLRVVAASVRIDP